MAKINCCNAGLPKSGMAGMKQTKGSAKGGKHYFGAGKRKGK